MSVQFTVKRISRYFLYFVLAILLLLVVLLGAVALALGTQSGSAWVLNQAVNQLENFPDIEFAFGESQGNLLNGLILTDVSFAQAETRVTLEKLEASWNPYSLLSGGFIVNTLYLEQPQLILAPASDEPAAEAELKPELVLFELSPLPVTIQVNDLQINQGSVLLGEQQIAVNKLHARVALIDETVEVSNLDLDVDGWLVRGDLGLDLIDRYPMDIKLSWRNEMDIAGLGTLSGELGVGGDLDSLQINHQLMEPFSIASNGFVRVSDLVEETGGEVFNITTTSEQLLLPLELPDAITLVNTSIRGYGNLQQIDLQVDTGINSDAFPPLQAAIEGQLVDLGQFLVAFNVKTGTGFFNGSGHVDWQNGIISKLDFELSEPDPLQFSPTELPVTLQSLETAGTVNFEMQDSDYLMQLTTDKLAFVLQDYEVQANTQLSLTPDGVTVTQLAIQAEDASLQLTGSFTDALDFEWQLQALNLQKLLPDAAGIVNARGEISGSIEQPLIDAQLSANNVAFGPVSSESIELTVNANEERSVNASLNVQAINYPGLSEGQAPASAEVKLEGTLDQHQLSALINSAYGDLNLLLSGNLLSDENIQWNGSLQEFGINSVAGNWAIENPASISYSPEAIDVERFCLQNDTYNNSAMCANLQSEGLTNYSANLSLQGYALEQLNSGGTEIFQSGEIIPGFTPLPENLALQGRVSADVELALIEGQEPDLSFDLHTENVALTVSELIEEGIDPELPDAPPPQVYELSTGRINGTFKSGAWSVASVLGLSQQNIEGSGLDLGANAEAEVSLGADNSLQGTVRLTAEDLSWLGAIVPQVSDFSGSIDGAFTVAGTVAEPELQGKLSVKDVGVTVAALGVSLEQSFLDLELIDLNTVKLDGQFNSNGGTLTLEAEASDLMTEQRMLGATLKGSDFQAMKTPMIQLEITPDLSVTASMKAVHVSGELLIPILDLVINELPQSAVGVSQDVVIVENADDSPESAASAPGATNSFLEIPVTGEVNIVLGDEVKFSGFGLSAELFGSLQVSQSANGSLLTYGDLGIKQGEYEIYGQPLQLQQGQLLFFGAVDNPALDIRAVRETATITAGVQMNGTLQNISSRLFSSPTMPDSDILAVLVTGKPISEAGSGDSDAMLTAVANLGLDQTAGLTDKIRDSFGLDALSLSTGGFDRSNSVDEQYQRGATSQSSSIDNSTLTIGKYLTPDIFVRYGVGLFNSQATLAVDYTLTERLKLQAESGESQSVDLTYTIER